MSMHEINIHMIGFPQILRIPQYILFQRNHIDVRYGVQLHIKHITKYISRIVGRVTLGYVTKYSVHLAVGL